MVNYGCDFSQSEMEQYFEWIIITFILQKNCPALSWARLFFPLVRRFSDGKGESKSLAFNAERVYPYMCIHVITVTIGSLSKDVFERRTSTGNEAFSLFICLDANKLVLLSFFSPLKTIYPRVSTKTLPNDAKSALPVDVRRSTTLLLKLPNEWTLNSTPGRSHPHPMKISTQNMSIRRMWTDFLKSRNIVYWGPLTKNKLWACFLLTRNKSVWALKWRED